ncbi:MAG: hypothetical protein ACRD0U_02295 [Acidimicrobiales bacterium]
MTERSDGPRLRWAWTARVSRPVVGWAFVVLGGILLIAGYWGVAHEALVAKQVPYLVSGGIGGMVLVGVGAFVLGSHDVRQQLERVERLEELVQDLHRTLLEPAVSPAEPSRNGFVALERGHSYHRPGCPMVAGKDAPAVDTESIERRHLEPCSLCEPAAAPA